MSEEDLTIVKRALRASLAACAAQSMLWMTLAFLLSPYMLLPLGISLFPLTARWVAFWTFNDMEADA